MSDATVQQSNQIVQYAVNLLGQQDGDGECYTLLDKALTAAGLKSARDFGDITPNADYVWGREVAANEVRAGDLIQFRNYRLTIVTETSITRPDGSDGGGSIDEQFQERPHHSAIVRVVPGSGGAHTVLECNVGGSRNVQSNQLHMASAQARTTTSTAPDGTVTRTTVTVTVSGTIKYYRAQTP